MGDDQARPQLLLQIPGQLEKKILFFLTGVVSTRTEVRSLQLCRKGSGTAWRHTAWGHTGTTRAGLTPRGDAHYPTPRAVSAAGKGEP